MLYVISSKIRLLVSSPSRWSTLLPVTSHSLTPPLSKLKLSCTDYYSQSGNQGTSRCLDMNTFPLLYLMPLWGFLASCPVRSTKYGPAKVILLPTPPGSIGIQIRYASTVKRTMRPLNMLSFTTQRKLRTGPPTSQGSPTLALPPHYCSQLCSCKDSQTTCHLRYLYRVPTLGL